MSLDKKGLLPIKAGKKVERFEQRALTQKERERCQ